MMYTQNPESVDEQGYYLKAQGEESPWMTETDCEEFDGIFDPSKEGYAIRDLESAKKAIATHGYKDEYEVVKLIWW